MEPPAPTPLKAPQQFQWEQDAKKLDEEIAKKQTQREMIVRAISSFQPPKVNPSPIRPGAGALVTLLAALTKQPKLLEGFMGGAVNRENIRVQNETAAANQKLRGMGAESDILGDQIGGLEKRQGQLISEGRYQQSRLDAERARTEAMTKEEDRLAQGNRQGFSTANTPAEARYFARLSQGTKFAVSPDELKAQIQALAQPKVKEFNQRILSIKDKVDLNEEDLKGLRAEREEIIADHGLSQSAIPPILTSTAYKKMAVDQRNKEIKARADQFQKTFNEKVKMNTWLRNIKFPQDLAVKWAMVDVAKENSITQGMNGNVNAARYEQSLLDSGSNEIVGKLDAQLQKIRQDMNKARVAFENPVGKNDKEKQVNAAKALQTFKTLTEQMKYVRQLRDEQNKNRSEGGLSVLPDREDQAGAMGYAPVNPMSGNITPRGSMGARPAPRTAAKPNASALRSRYNY